jgi:hypothetical protein
MENPTPAYARPCAWRDCTTQGWRTLITPGRKEGDKTIDPVFGDYTWLSYREVQDLVESIGSGLVDRDLIPESGPERVRAGAVVCWRSVGPPGPKQVPYPRTCAPSAPGAHRACSGPGIVSAFSLHGPSQYLAPLVRAKRPRCTPRTVGNLVCA